MRPIHSRHFFIVTGGPGAGKTTLLDALRRDGFDVAPEAGRAIIRSQRSIDGRARPDHDPALYTELMLCWELRSYEEARAAGGVRFFDRGIPDLVGYCRLTGLPLPEHLRRAMELFRYNEIVFIAPPWREIYHQDAERLQTFAQAERTYEAMCEAYEEAGYKLVHLPRAPACTRRDFVLSMIGN